MIAPKVFINLPVFNGASTLKRQLDSIFTQTYSNFKLFLSDNASNDDTAAICQSYQSDPRFEYHRNIENLGIGTNFNRGIYCGLAAEYLIYASHNDYWEPTYLQKCVTALDDHPEASLAYSFCRLVKDGKATLYQDNFTLTGLSPAERFLTVMKCLDLCTPFYGLMRVTQLLENEIYLYAGSAGNDNLFLTALAFSGPFIQLEEPLFTREMPVHAYRSIPERRTIHEDMNNRRLKTPSFPFLSHLISSLSIAMSRPGGFEERNELFAEVINVSLMRSARLIEEEMKLVIDNMLAGRLHTGFSGETDFENGRFQYLDYFTTLRIIEFLEKSRFFLVEEPAGLNLGRALCYLMLGRLNEAKNAAEMELRNKGLLSSYAVAADKLVRQLTGHKS